MKMTPKSKIRAPLPQGKNAKTVPEKEKIRPRSLRNQKKMAATKKKIVGPEIQKKVFLCTETFCDKLDTLIS